MAAAPLFGLNVHTMYHTADPVGVAQHAGQLGFDLVTTHREVHRIILRRPAAKSRSDRLDRCRPLFEDPGGPLRTDVIPYADLFVEPFYQLMRQQLLAHAMERSGELGADTVRVLHIAPAANTKLQLSLTRDSHQAAGATLYAAWRAILRRADRFVTLDSARLATAVITSEETSRGTRTAELGEQHRRQPGTSGLCGSAAGDSLGAPIEVGPLEAFSTLSQRRRAALTPRWVRLSWSERQAASPRLSW
jgi:Restriction Endonuclease associating with ARP